MPGNAVVHVTHGTASVADCSFYDGLGGVCVFLAMLVRVDRALTSDATIRTLVQRLCMHINECARDALATAQTSPHGAADCYAGWGVGAGSGPASAAFVLLWCASALLDEELLASALSLLLHPACAVASDKDIACDILGGNAGLVCVACCAVDVADRLRGAEYGDAVADTLLPIVNHAVAVLKEQARGSVGRWGYVGWEVIPGTAPLAGMSHGTSGIAWALVRGARLLARCTDASQARTSRTSALSSAEPSAVLQVACDALEAEDSRHFDMLRGNWRDGRYSAEPVFNVAWCHGSPGCVLARAAMRQMLPTFVADMQSGATSNATTDDVHTARRLASIAEVGTRRSLQGIVTRYEEMRRAGADSNALLCCGFAGLVDVLAYVSCRRPAASIHGHTLVAHRDGHETTLPPTLSMLQAHALVWCQHMYKVLPDVLSGLPQPTSLFTGLAGLGYMALRLADATQPCVLLLEV